MNFDFAAILVLATLTCGVIWAIDAVALAPRRRAARGEDTSIDESVDGNGDKSEPIVVEYARSFFPILLAVLLLRSFLVEPFRIPSGSMIPTLKIGDFILVNKFAYGLRWPVLDSKFVSIGAPERGDVVVFRFPDDPSVDYIKRVVGLPGDTISYRGKRLIVNGEPVPVEVERTISANSTSQFDSDLKRERVEGRDYLIRVSRIPETHPYDCLYKHRGAYKVPEGQYFVMGDNRDNSNDSRFWCAVPEGNLVGKAFFIWMNWNGGVEWGRIGTSIQ